MPTFNGTSAAERLLGGVGNDVFFGFEGADTLEGGAGVDTADYGNSTANVNVNLTTGQAQDGYGSVDVLISIEDVGGSDFNDVIVGDGGNNFIHGRGGADSVDGGAGDDFLVGGWGDDTLIGGPGNDLLKGETGHDLLIGGDGFDTVTYEDSQAGIAIDIYDGTWDDDFQGIENVFGSRYNDDIKGDYQDNILKGFEGNDIFEGREGDDQIDGGEGSDTVFYNATRATFQVQQTADGWLVTDTRTNGMGKDTLRAVEVLKFTDTTMNLTATGPINATLGVAVSNILRIDPQSSSLAANLSQQISAGSLTVAAAINEVVKFADASTSVATLSYQFFTGAIPGQGGIDYLVSPSGPNPNHLNSSYYLNFNLENRYINFAVNLGRDGEGKTHFGEQYGSLSLFEATRKAYGEIFGGGAPGDAKVQDLLSGGRDAYFEFYGKDGPNGQGTKAAMVGWLLSEAVKADVGMYARSNDAFLLDLSDGAAFGVSLIGLYGKPEFNYDGAA